MKKIRFLMLFFLTVFSVAAWAQTEVTGVVLDDANFPLPGVNVLVKGSKKGIVTDIDGRFSIKASVGDVIEFSYIGLETQEVTIKNYNKLDIKLQSSAMQLEDLVVVGYGSKRKKDVTGAVTSVKNDAFNRGIVTSPEQLIQGKVSGVNITSASGEPGSNQAISIRGQGGVRTGSTPLFVIDGFALDNSSTGGATNPLSFINADDIESIDVLKDASATAIYGSRGANGVILITTKRGKKGQSKVTYSTSLGTSSMAKEIPVYSADAFRAKVVEIGGQLIDLGGSTNWQKEITRTAFSQKHNLNLSGGADNLTYFASIGHQDQQGILKNSELKKLSGRINLTQKMFNNRLKIDLNLNATNTKSERPAIESLIGTALSLNPTYPAYDENGAPSIFADVFNPLIRLNLYEDLTNTNRIIANISPSFEIIKGLDYKLNLGVDNSNSDRDIQNRPSTLPQQDGRLDSYYISNKNNLIENYITYNFDLGENNFSLLAGHSYQKTFVQYRHWSIDKFKDNGIDPKYNPGLGQELDLIDNLPSGSAIKNELQSFFGRVGYSLKDRYLLTATFRRDGSSKFGSNNKYGNFPSFAAGWRISEEEFMKSSPFSNLKLRAGWGRTGNQEIPSKITQASSTTSVTGSTSYPLNPAGTFPGGTTYARFANPDIQWEVSSQTNVGLDFGLFNGALSGTVDYFNKVSDNILLEVVPSDPIQAASTYWTNVKDMTITNKGLELALAYEYKNENGVSFSLGGNVSFIDNKIENSPFTVLTTGSASGSGLSSATINGYVNGQPIGTFYMKEFIGINDQGMSMFRDVNGDGLDTDADRVVAGSALPDKLYSFYGNIAYKGFDLNFNFNGVSGNKIYDNTANSSFYKARLAKSLNTTAAAAQYPSESITNPASISTRYLKNGAFIRLNNLSLGYNLNPKTIGIQDWVSSMRFSLTGQNLFVITDYDGYDPEVNTDRSVDGVTSYGIDYLSYPKARTFLFGFNVSF
ncbi:SusC/RagA family TonB-linked outer membrane protein [Flavobacterium yafengii]|uniref:SusC/RagA family TonB-linked outer membrane protein n=1 Tax=Flavobacterium yafengii TaxID=3041253 RepID=UPI0024A9510C|nr:TonB-dependent receptor [Flavobacterium yafengii]MDI5897160.1 TonB-dependent receptor [Flavobacterium yafengii]